MVGHEAHRLDHEIPDALGREPPDLVANVRTQPRLAGAAGALERDPVAREAQPAGDERRRGGNLGGIRVPFRDDPGGQAVGGEQYRYQGRFGEAC
jgi:hypothetical protein